MQIAKDHPHDPAQRQDQDDLQEESEDDVTVHSRRSRTASCGGAGTGIGAVGQVGDIVATNRAIKRESPEIASTAALECHGCALAGQGDAFAPAKVLFNDRVVDQLHGQRLAVGKGDIEVPARLLDFHVPGLDANHGLFRRQFPFASQILLCVNQRTKPDNNPQSRSEDDQPENVNVGRLTHWRAPFTRRGV